MENRKRLIKLLTAVRYTTNDIEKVADEICLLFSVVGQCEHDYDYYRNQYGEEVRFCCKCLKGYF